MIKNISILCCSVFRDEITSIFSNEFPDITIEFLDSMMHMRPTLLQETLEQKLSTQSNPTIIVYGDCAPEIHNIEERFLCVRTKGVNCNELLLGKNRYREYRNKKVFLLLPEWAHRWKEVFQEELGFKDTVLARRFMQENSNFIYYLDTGFTPVPYDILKEIETYFEMPIEVISETTEPLRAFIYTAMDQLQKRCINEQ